MRTQIEKAEAFRALHARPGAFIIPNPWDAGTAKLLAAMGFEALATTSLGLANTLGSVTVSLDAIIENCRTIADATDLPVNADLENCGADDPNTAAKAIARAAEAGCVGGSIEDSTGNSQKPIYDFSLAVERVQAAVEAARALAFPFTLTARAENFLYGRTDLASTIAAFASEALGAAFLLRAESAVTWGGDRLKDRLDDRARTGAPVRRRFPVAHRCPAMHEAVALPAKRLYAPLLR